MPERETPFERKQEAAAAAEAASIGGRVSDEPPPEDAFDQPDDGRAAPGGEGDTEEEPDA
jgi:hypothetical protein